jgi:hypothetical protein
MADPPVSNDDFGTRHGRDATGRGGRTATSSSTSYGTTSKGDLYDVTDQIRAMKKAGISSAQDFACAVT